MRANIRERSEPASFVVVCARAAALYFFTRFDVGGEFLGPIYALARFISLFSYLLIPWLVDRYGEIPTIVASRLISGFLAVALSIASSLPVAVIVLVVGK